MFSSSRPSQFIIVVISLSLFVIGSQRRKFLLPDLAVEIGAIIKAPNVKLQEQQQQQQWKNSSWLKDCFKFNSKAWLHGPRVRNIQVPDELLIPMMQQSRQLFDHIIVDKLLGQTLYYPTGRFRNTSYSTMKSNESSSSQSNEWELRLFYLILNRHFHMNAFSEFRQRQACGSLKVPSPSLASSSQNYFDQVRPQLPYDLGNFDYEYPGSKFLVIVVSTRAGMGAVVKNGVVPSLFMAFATGRIPLFLQAVEGKGLPSVFTNRLPLASCDRGDWQCVFLPTSPCVLTLEDLRNATVLNENETRDLKKRAYLPSSLNETRVLNINLSDMKPIHARFAIHEKMRKKALEVIQEILHHWNTTKAYETSAVQRDVLVAEAESMSTPYTAAEASQNRKLRMQRAGLFYVLRPNPMARREIELQLHDAMPNQTDASNRQFFGVPIRGSDKCRFESTCLPFERYMELILLRWTRHRVPGQRGTILLSSEDPRILPLRHAYTQNSSFPLDFVILERDVQPGTGKSNSYNDRADAIVISSLIVLKMQLMSNVLIGNCCSNFHGLLFELAGEGCGANPNMHMECLNKMEDPRFRICCGWTQGGECQQIWKEHRSRIASSVFKESNVTDNVSSDHGPSGTS